MHRCPDCDEPVGPDAMNIREGVALCPACGRLSRLARLFESDHGVEEIARDPPAGCLTISSGGSAVATASTQSLSSFVGAAAAALFWNGIVAVFVLIAAGSLYRHLVGPLPPWFPAPNVKEGIPLENGQPMTLGMTLFLCLFLTPFVTIGAGLVVHVAMTLFGSVRVVLGESDSYVATGIGFVAWKRRFDPRCVRFIGFGETAWQSNGRSHPLIELVADRTIRFGSLLTAERRSWLRAVLAESLLPARRARAPRPF